MLYIKIKNFLYNNKYTLSLLIFMFLFLFATEAEAAATFAALSEAGGKIFKGLRKIVFKAATIGIACVCIAGMFGNFNWKWFAAIGLAVFAMATAGAIVELTGASGADLSGES